MDHNHPLQPYPLYHHPSSVKPTMEAIRLAEVLVRKLGDEKAIEFIAQHCDPKAVEYFIQTVCSVRRMDFHAIMSSEGSEPSQAPYYSTSQVTLRPCNTSLPDQPTLPLTPVSHASSLGTNSSSSRHSSSVPAHEFIWAFNVKDERKRLSMRHAPQSHCLISDEIVHERLHFTPEKLTHPVPVVYDNGFLTATHQVQLTFTRSGTLKTCEATFFLVSAPLDTDLIFGDLKTEPDASHIQSELLNTAQTALPNSLGFAHSSLGRGHQRGVHIQEFTQAQSTVISSNDFTDTRSSARRAVPTARRPSSNRSDLDFRGRFQATTSERTRDSTMRRMSGSSQIPRPATSSTSSSGSAALDYARPSGRTTSGSSAMPPPSHGGTPPFETTGITIVWGQRQVPERWDLNISGESFFRLLDKTTRRIRRNLDRNVHFVRISTECGAEGDNFCIISLMEDRINHAWEVAVNWIRSNSGDGTRGFYAMIEEDEDDVP